jgi:hypothetical protein
MIAHEPINMTGRLVYIVVSLLIDYLSNHVSFILIEPRHFSKDFIQRFTYDMAVLVISILSLNNYSVSLSPHFESLNHLFNLHSLLSRAWSLKFTEYFFLRFLMIPQWAPVHAPVSVYLLGSACKAEVFRASAIHHIAPVLQLDRGRAPRTLLNI